MPCRNLSSVPVFGFEWENCNANQCRRNHRRHHSLTIDDGAEDVSYIATNIFKVVGAFVPLVGIGRIMNAICVTDESNKVWAIVRGIMELSGLGAVALGIDIAVTVGRAIAISLDDYNASANVATA